MTGQSALPPSRRTWSERIQEAFAELDVDAAAPGAPAPTGAGAATRSKSADVQNPESTAHPAERGPTIVPSPDVLRATHRSAWGNALSLAEVRRQRRAAGLDAGVRAIARSLETSAARASDLLQIVDALTVTDVQLIGLLGGPEGDTWTAIEERGHARLAALSFRALRTVVRLPMFRRIAQIKRLAEQAPAGSSTGGAGTCHVRESKRHQP